MKRKAQFMPPWWLKNNHFQSCFSYLIKPRANAVLRWEEISLPDGDFIDLAWSGPRKAPIILLLHGLEGSVHSHYIQAMLDHFLNHGYQVVTMHFRGCGRRLNLMPKTYHGGENGDLTYLIEVLIKRFPSTPFSVIGFSLGGNVLLHYLSKNPSSQINSAISVSTPFELAKCVYHTATFYQSTMLKNLKTKVYEKIKRGMSMPVSEKQLDNINSLYEFDELLTVPLNEFNHKEEYYRKVSSRYVLYRIKTPTLILHAEDDPLVPKECIPKPNELSQHITMEVTEQGGHIGFIHGDYPWRPTYWLGERILSFLKNQK